MTGNDAELIMGTNRSADVRRSQPPRPPTNIEPPRSWAIRITWPAASAMAGGGRIDLGGRLPGCQCVVAELQLHFGVTGDHAMMPDVDVRADGMVTGIDELVKIAKPAQGRSRSSSRGHRPPCNAASAPPTPGLS